MTMQIQFARIRTDPGNGLSLVSSVKTSMADTYLDAIEEHKVPLMTPGPWVCLHLKDDKPDVIAVVSFTVHDDMSVTEGIELSLVNISRWPPRRT